MSFFKKYNGTVNKRLARLETLTWTLIYGGLLLVLVGVFMQRGGDGSGGPWLLGVGAVAAVVGVALIFVRSRLHEESHATKPPARERQSR